MYKYIAKLSSTGDVIAQANTIEDVEGQIKTFKRQQKSGIHTNANVKINIYHIEQNHKAGLSSSKEKFVKSI